MTDGEHKEWLRDELERKQRPEVPRIHSLHHPLPQQEDDAERSRRIEEEELLKKKKLAEEEDEDDDDDAEANEI